MDDTMPSDAVLLDPDTQLELDVLGTIIHQLAMLDKATQRRIVAYVRDRFGDRH